MHEIGDSVGTAKLHLLEKGASSSKAADNITYGHIVFLVAMPLPTHILLKFSLHKKYKVTHKINNLYEMLGKCMTIKKKFNAEK